MIQKQAFQATSATIPQLSLVPLSELKRAEEELRANRESFRAFMAHSSDAIWCFEYRPPIPVTLPPQEQLRQMVENGYVAECNLAMAQRYLASQPADLLNQPLRNFLNLTEDDKTVIRRFIAGGYRLTNIEIAGSNGETLLSNFDGLVEDGCLTRVCGVQRDITALKQAQDALAKSEQRLELALGVGGLGLWDMNLTTRAVYVNDQWFRQLGQQPGDAEDISAFWLARLHPDNRTRIAEIYQEFLEGAKTSYQAEYRMRHHDGSWRWIASSGRAVEFTADGKPLRLIGVNQDITEHKNLEETFRQAQKMDAVGRLAGGIAHDFNNLLTVIKGYADITLAELSRSDPLYGRIDEIHKAAARATALTGQLLAFSRKQLLQPQVINLNTIVPSLENMLRRLIGEDIELRTSLAPDLGHIEVDPHQIEQALVNLVVNARDSMPAGGWITIGTTNATRHAVTPTQHGSAPQNYVMLAVSDTGHGIDGETQKHIFEPFFTTKEPGQGTGLGLATIYGLVRQSGGLIECESEVGLGTSFKLYFPRCARPIGKSELPEKANPLRPGRETILLVEDEARVRQLAAELLRGWGYHVVEAANGQEALQVFSHSPREIDLVLTDAVMPGMSGPELSERLRKLRPELKLIWMSGYTEDEMVRRGGSGQEVSFLLKPFNLDDLARCVRTTLDA